MNRPSLFRYMQSHDDYFSSTGKLLKFAKNQYIIRPDDPHPYVFFLKEGMVELSFTRPDGVRRIVGYVAPGTTFAEARTFFDDRAEVLEYTTVMASKVYRVGRDDFVNQLKYDADFNIDYIALLLRNQLFLLDRIAYLGENNIYHRALRWILMMEKYYSVSTAKGHVISVALTQEIIGDFLHASRESVSKTMSLLIADGLISMSKKRVTILDSEKIRIKLER